MIRTGKIFLLLAVAVLVSGTVGCSSNNKGKIEGTKWKSLAAKIKGQSIPAGAVTLEFGKDKSLKYGIAGMVLTGTYSLRSGDTVVFKMDKELAGHKVHHEKVTVKDGKLTVTDQDGTQITFVSAN